MAIKLTKTVCSQDSGPPTKNIGKYGIWNFRQWANWAIDHHNALEPGCKIGYAHFSTRKSVAKVRAHPPRLANPPLVLV